jgi:hypothetical protein
MAAIVVDGAFELPEFHKQRLRAAYGTLFEQIRVGGIRL